MHILKNNVVSAVLFTLAMAVGSNGVRANNWPLYLHTPSVLLKAERSVSRGEPDRIIQLLSGKVDRMRRPMFRSMGFGLLCVAYHQKQDVIQAEELCDRAVKTADSRWNEMNNRGVMRFKLGRYADALVDFKAAASMMVLTGTADEKGSVRRNIASVTDRIGAL